MKQLNPDSLLPFDEEPPEEETQELAQVIPIRTETTLARHPFHRLAKRGIVLIRKTSKNERGKVITTWEVENPPGPLAYKIDTLIINRRIDEMRQRGEIWQLFKVGSLTEISQELGFADSGRNRALIREALHENAKAYIRAKLDYKGNDGSEREFEFGTTRYTIIFTGEKLPNGKKADAVYIELHPRYHEMLNRSKTRPLNYEYLKELAPAAQRLYELLSFAMFGTLMHGRPNAQMLYSEFCQSAPLTRHTEFYRVRSQMRKIHKPHIESGYIKSVEFQETTDEGGTIDWLMKYTPGRRARHEFRAFTKKQEKLVKQREVARPRLIKPKTVNEAPPLIREPKRSAEEAAIIEKLMSLGVDESRAAQLVKADRAECELWGDAWPHQNQNRMENPAAVLISFIEKKRRPLPKGYKEAKEREARQKEQQQQQERAATEEIYLNYFSPKFRAYQREDFQRLQGENPKEVSAFQQWFEKDYGKTIHYIESPARREAFTLDKAEDFFNGVRSDLGVRLTTFREWNDQHNAEACDPLEWCAKNPRLVEELFRQ